MLFECFFLGCASDHRVCKTDFAFVVISNIGRKLIFDITMP